MSRDVRLGLVFLTLVVVAMVAAFRAGDLPLVGGGDAYAADFTEAGGLRADDAVRVAGVRVGKVEAVELDGDHVRVTFRVERHTELGTTTGASIRVATVLGRMYLALEPAGPGLLEAGAEIPTSRTVAPYDVVQAFSGLGETAGDIDADQLAASLTTLADLTRRTPEEFRAALQGVSALSEDIAAKDERIRTLLANLERVSATLHDRDTDIVTLMRSSTVLFEALVQRRDAIHDVLVSTTTLARELTALVEQSKQDLGPALAQLDDVVGILDKNEDQIDDSLRLFAPFVRVFTNTLGNGPWFDGYIQNLPPVPDLTNGGGAG
jgi:phospholipid/cholesterol/gamma-HCH transport system substrate-binding protein